MNELSENNQNEILMRNWYNLFFFLVDLGHLQLPWALQILSAHEKIKDLNTLSQRSMEFVDFLFSRAVYMHNDD